MIREGAGDMSPCFAVVRIERFAMVAYDVISVLQKMSGQNRDHGFMRMNLSIFDEPLDARDGRCRSRLAADTVAANDRLGVRDLLFADAQHAPSGPAYRAPGFLPRNGSADFDRRRQRHGQQEGARG